MTPPIKSNIPAIKNIQDSILSMNLGILTKLRDKFKRYKPQTKYRKKIIVPNLPLILINTKQHI